MRAVSLLRVGMAVAVGTLMGACAVASGPVEGDEDLGATSDELGNKIFCGGIAGFACPDNYTCVDDPSDKCSPKTGGADCGGYCKKAPKQKAGCKSDQTKTYVSTNPDQCALIHFYCAEGVPFFDDCGCGCQTGVGGVPCNEVSCGAGEFCCNESCSICAPEGGFCTQQFCGEATL